MVSPGKVGVKCRVWGGKQNQ